MSKKKYRHGRREGNWFSRLSKGKKVGLCIGGVFLCLTLAGLIYVAAKLNMLVTEEIPTEEIIINAEAQEVGEGYTNVALFGIDSRNGELESGTRSDCIIVASLNNKTKEVRMISVYRDTLLDVEDNYLQKCNAAYSFGGPKQAINMLNSNLDLDIQDYVTVDFTAVANAIDLLGGIEIDVKQEEVSALNKYLDETASVAGKKANKITKPGLQNLDGAQATTYARIRSTAGGDFTRTERQRLVIEKIIKKAQKSDIATINKIIDELFPTIKTSFTITEIFSYAKDFMKYTIGDSSGFPFDKTTDTISGLGSIVIPVTLETNVSALHEFLYDTMDYKPSEVVCDISDAIIYRVGQREATDDSVLNNQTYQSTQEDVAQESNQYDELPPLTGTDNLPGGEEGEAGDNSNNQNNNAGNTETGDSGTSNNNGDETGGNAQAGGENGEPGEENTGGAASETGGSADVDNTSAEITS